MTNLGASVTVVNRFLIEKKKNTQLCTVAVQLPVNAS